MILNKLDHVDQESEQTKTQLKTEFENKRESQNLINQDNNDIEDKYCPSNTDEWESSEDEKDYNSKPKVCSNGNVMKYQLGDNKKISLANNTNQYSGFLVSWV